MSKKSKRKSSEERQSSEEQKSQRRGLGALDDLLTANNDNDTEKEEAFVDEPKRERGPLVSRRYKSPGGMEYRIYLEKLRNLVEEVGGLLNEDSDTYKDLYVLSIQAPEEFFDED